MKTFAGFAVSAILLLLCIVVNVHGTASTLDDANQIDMSMIGSPEVIGDDEEIYIPADLANPANETEVTLDDGETHSQRHELNMLQRQAQKAAMLRGVTLAASGFSYSFKFSGKNMCYGGARTWSTKKKGAFSQASALKACASCAAKNRFYSCGPYPDPHILCNDWHQRFIPAVVNPGSTHLAFIWHDIKCWGKTIKKGAILAFHPHQQPRSVGRWM